MASTAVVIFQTRSVCVEQSCQADLAKDSGHRYFLSILADPQMTVGTYGNLFLPSFYHRVYEL